MREFANLLDASTRQFALQHTALRDENARVQKMLAEAIGNLTRNLEQSTAFAGKARVGFLDCPPGTYNVVVDTQLGGGPFTVPVTCLADGAALGQTGLLP